MAATEIQGFTVRIVGAWLQRTEIRVVRCAVDRRLIWLKEIETMCQYQCKLSYHRQNRTNENPVY